MQGEFEIAAIQRNIKSKSHVLFLRGQELQLAPHASLKPIDNAINAHITAIESGAYAHQTRCHWTRLLSELCVTH
eukprot:1300690-Prymnesium_polylepis.1